MGRYLRGNVDEQTALGTLSAAALLRDLFDETVDERCLLSSIVATYSFGEGAGNQGPIRVGLAHSDYTAAEISEYIDNTGSWSEGNKISQEISKRLVREIGVFTGETPEGSLNDGKPIKTRLNWILGEDQGLQSWYINEDTSVLTTGLIMHIDGHVNLWVL